MATISLTPAQQATRSTVALKALMAVTGLILIGYLLAHMYGNLKIFAGEEAFNDYAHHLRTLGEPILPYSGALWIIRLFSSSAFSPTCTPHSACGGGRTMRGAVRGGTTAKSHVLESSGPMPRSRCAGAVSSSCSSSSTTCT